MGRARQTSTTRSRPNPIPNPNPNRTGLHQFSLFDGRQPATGRCGLEQPTHGNKLYCVLTCLLGFSCSYAERHGQRHFACGGGAPF